MMLSQNKINQESFIYIYFFFIYLTIIYLNNIIIILILMIIIIINNNKKRGTEHNELKLNKPCRSRTICLCCVTYSVKLSLLAILAQGLNR